MIGIRERNMQEVTNAAISIASRYNWNPEDLVAIVSYETGGTFNPWQKGSSEKTQTRGLFQWIPENVEKYEISPTMTIAEQMEAGARYLMDRGVKPGDGLLPMYAAVNAGHASRVNASDFKNGGRPGTVAQKVQGKDFAGHIARGKELVEKYVNPSTMNGYSRLTLPDIIDGVTQLSGSGQIATPSPRPDPASVPEYNREAQRAAAFSAMPAIQTAPGGIIGPQPGLSAAPFSPPDIARNPYDIFDLGAGWASAPSSRNPAFSPRDNIGTQGMFDALPQTARLDAAMERAQSMQPPSRSAVQPSDKGASVRSIATALRDPYARPAAPMQPSTAPMNNLGISTAFSGRPVQDIPSSAPASVPDPRAAAYQSLPPAPTYQARQDRIDIPYSAVTPTDIASAITGLDERGTQRDQVQSALAAQAAPATRSVAPPPPAPTTVAPRAPTQTAPAQPAMTPEKARALGMVPTPGVPGAYMPNVAPNPAQVMKDQLGLIGANPLEAIGRMVVGALQGGVFHSGTGIFSNPGGLWGNPAPQGTQDAYGGVGGGLGGLGGGFQAGGGNWGNYGSSGTFNSGFTSGSGFTYDR